jgi:alpha-1,3-rhamnosyl/mannosyltransferase
MDAKRGKSLKVILSIDPIKFPLTGIGRYTWELATKLGKMTEIESMLYFQGSHFQNTLPTTSRTSAPASTGTLESLVNYAKQMVLKIPLTISMYSLATAYSKTKTLRGFGDHLFHGTNYYLPNFTGPSVVTVHDLSIYTWSHFHPPERVRYMHSEIQRSLQRASRLITVSDFSRKEIAEYFDWPLEKIHAIPLASAQEFYPRSTQDLHQLLSFFDLKPDQYCLFVGTIEPRKNIASLLNAYEILPISLRKRYPLVLAGFKGWKSDNLHARITKAERAGWARYLGFVTAEDLPLLFAGARLFAFPSLYEGFGLPVLEAMASGVPVVCSNSSSLPEVAGDAAALCDPHDVDKLSLLLAEGLENEMWRDSARAKGLAQAQRFSWERCAQETANIYQKVVESR